MPMPERVPPAGEKWNAPTASKWGRASFPAPSWPARFPNDPPPPPSFRAEQADFFFPLRSREAVGLRREKSLFLPSSLWSRFLFEDYVSHCHNPRPWSVSSSLPPSSMCAFSIPVVLPRRPRKLLVYHLPFLPLSSENVCAPPADLARFLLGSAGAPSSELHTPIERRHRRSAAHGHVALLHVVGELRP